MFLLSSLRRWARSRRRIETLSPDDLRLLRDVGIAPNDVFEAINARRSSIWRSPMGSHRIDGDTVRIRASRPADGEALVDVWRAAVDATHKFLSPLDRQLIDQQVQEFLPNSPLWLAVDGRDDPVGFMGLEGPHVAALFIHPKARGVGVGRSLVGHARGMHPVLTTDVNEQNRQAVGFYLHLGFVRTGRSATDGDGRPYPLLHMKLDPAAARVGG